MIRCAKARGLPPQAEFAVQSLNRLPEPDSVFDHVICLNVFPHFSNHPHALAQIARVLKPGGHLWINHFEGRDGLNKFHHEAAPEVAEHMLPDGVSMRGLMAGAGLELTELRDGPDVYMLHAVKPGQ
jgi:ubiquinone/menaquinone biosynthesis C-methylase UbiE